MSARVSCKDYDRVRALLSKVVLTVQFSSAEHHQALLADIRKELGK